MKILAIRGENLASLAGNFEIDFTKEPLASAGIFAITGSTGAGKSTLLDALCIALYGTSPRINKLSPVNEITDAGKYSIKERDSRNILRKGATSAFAEVDFKALNNKLYRARWSTRRANNKSLGKLKDAEYALYDLSENEKIIHSGKTETLAKIKELIGLTYEQFTRAVLLAQGEFATFLKADPKDKAEILEKLTGSDIYSKISGKIYEHWREADTEVKLIEKKIKEAYILTDEECEALENKLLELNNALQASEKKVIALEKSAAWIERKELLKKNLQKAEENLLDANTKLTSAQGLIEHLALIDSVQEIRDTYTGAMETKRHIDESNALLQKEELSIETLNKEYTESEKKVTLALKEQESLNTEWLKVQPKINAALAIEADLRNIETRLKEQESNIEKQKKELEKTSQEEGLLRKTIAQQAVELKELEAWFAQHANYATIVPKGDTVIANIKDIEEQLAQIKKRENLAAEATALLATEEKRLKEKEEEAEMLNKMLPAEILTLRARLVEGEPCPVCGSRHHHILEAASNNLKEEELKKAKESLARNIELIQKNIEESKSSINSHKAYIESIKNNIKNCEERNREILQPLSSYAQTFDTLFASKLQELASLWNKNTNRKATLNEELAVNKTKLTTLQERIKEKEDEACKNASTVTENKKLQQEKRNKIAELIGEKHTAEELNNIYNNKIIAVNNAVTTAVESRGNIMAAREKLLGSIAQTKKTLKTLGEAQQNAKTEIENFLLQRADELTLPKLHALLTTSNAEIMQHRSTIEVLRNNLLTAKATHNERLKAIEEHSKEADKPQESETLDTIKEATKAAIEEKKQLLDSVSETAVKIKTNKENQKQHAHNLKELSEKSEILNKWVILNNAYGSSTGDKFKIIAQGYTLDILLEYANNHLHDISPRYKLARTAHDSLGIKVIDTDIMNEERSVHSLSGGETFLVSLALALSLSSFSSNKMSIESLFIDEGFGALDNDTLRTAMEALERLQGQGRKVGIISHLQDIIERISTKIKVVKEQEGKSKVFIESY